MYMSCLVVVHLDLPDKHRFRRNATKSYMKILNNSCGSSLFKKEKKNKTSCSLPLPFLIRQSVRNTQNTHKKRLSQRRTIDWKNINITWAFGTVFGSKKDSIIAIIDV